MILSFPCPLVPCSNGVIFCSYVIVLNVRWYCRYALSYRNLEEMMRSWRHSSVDHSTLNRWVLKYAPELDLRIRPHLQSTNDSWGVDETYVKVKRVWKYLDRAVDSMGNTLEFMLSAKRDSKAAERFFRKVLNMVYKGQVQGVAQGDSVGQAQFIATIFGAIA